MGLTPKCVEVKTSSNKTSARNHYKAIPHSRTHLARGQGGRGRGRLTLLECLSPLIPPTPDQIYPRVEQDQDIPFPDQVGSAHDPPTPFPL